MTTRADAPSRSKLRRRSAPALRLAAALLLGAPLATAQGEPSGSGEGEGPGSEGEDPNAVFREGLQHFQAEEYGEAIRAWERVLQAIGEERGRRLLYNLGLAYERVGDPTKAIESFRGFARPSDAEAAAPPSPEVDERRRDALERARALEAAHGALVVRPPADGGEVLVRVDDGPARAAGFTVYLVPGLHRVELFAGTDRPVREQVELGAGTSLEIVPAREPVPSTPPPSPPVQPPPSPPIQPPPRPPGADAGPEEPPAFPTAWVATLGTLTVVSAALPLTLRERALDRRRHANELERGHSQYAAQVRRFEEAQRAYRISYALPATFGVAAAAVVVVHVVRTRDDRAERATVTAGISPWAVTVSGDF